MLSDPLFLSLATLAVILIGLAKGGFAGVGALAMPVLAMACSPVQAATILLPILIMGDIVSVWAFRHSWNRRIVAIMLPGGLLGIGIGWSMAAYLPITAIMADLGVIAIAFGLWRLWIERGGRVPAPSMSSPMVGSFFGLVTGFTSQIGHAAARRFKCGSRRKGCHIWSMWHLRRPVCLVELCENPRLFCLG